MWAVVSRVWVGGGEAAMDTLPAGAAAWVGETRCELQPPPSSSFPAAASPGYWVLALQLPITTPTAPAPTHSLLGSAGREGRGEGSPWGQQAGDPKLPSLFSHHPRALDCLPLLSFNRCLLSTYYVPTLW